MVLKNTPPWGALAGRPYDWQAVVFQQSQFLCEVSLGDHGHLAVQFAETKDPLTEKVEDHHGPFALNDLLDVDKGTLEKTWFRLRWFCLWGHGTHLSWKQLSVPYIVTNNERTAKAKDFGFGLSRSAWLIESRPRWRTCWPWCRRWPLFWFKK